MGVLGAKARKKSATVVVDGKAKYPIPDKAHARAALGRINQAKPPLTAAQKAKVAAKAHRVLGDGIRSNMPKPPHAKTAKNRPATAFAPKGEKHPYAGGSYDRVRVRRTRSYIESNAQTPTRKEMTTAPPPKAKRMPKPPSVARKMTAR